MMKIDLCRCLEKRNTHPMGQNQKEYMFGPSGTNKTKDVVENEAPDPQTPNPILPGYLTSAKLKLFIFEQHGFSVCFPDLETDLPTPRNCPARINTHAMLFLSTC